jgi:hypothetical protein
MTTAAPMLVSIFAHQKGNIELEIPSSLKVLDGGQSKPEKHSVFRIINQKDGDKRVVWNSRVIEEIDDAKVMFDSLVEKGFVPYRVGDAGKKSASAMKEFDPMAEEVIFAPIQAMVGG